MRYYPAYPLSGLIEHLLSKCRHDTARVMPCWRLRVAAPVFPCQCVSASVSRRGRSCVPAPLWPPQPGAALVRSLQPLHPPVLARPGSKVAESLPSQPQLSSAQINKLSWRLHSLSFVWLPHRLAPCQNVSCELRKVAENYAVSCVNP